MKALLATPGRFHTFALARELLAASALDRIVTGFPWTKVAREKLPRDHVETAPLAQLIRFGLIRVGLHNNWIDQRLLLEALRRVDRRACEFVDEADVFVALSGCGLAAGRRMRELEKPYICDRGSSHILYQMAILDDEADRNSAPRPFFHPEVVARELQEYETANAITVPSTFAQQSFVAQGVPAAKIHRIPYGVNLANFFPTESPDADTFDVLFVGALTLQKGLPYLLQAFNRFKHPRKRLTLVGMRTPETRFFERQLKGDAIFSLGHIPNVQLKQVMSRSHVMVLTSVQEGLALVLGEALACGCPIIASENTGARDLIVDGCEGFVVPIRDPQAIQEKLEYLADSPLERERMSLAAIDRMKSLGGWRQYGETYLALLNGLVNQA